MIIVINLRKCLNKSSEQNSQIHNAYWKDIHHYKYIPNFGRLSLMIEKEIQAKKHRGPSHYVAVKRTKEDKRPYTQRKR